jgi:hypothetical protein
MSNFSAISEWERTSYIQWDDNDVCFAKVILFSCISVNDVRIVIFVLEFTYNNVTILLFV